MSPHRAKPLQKSTKKGREGSKGMEETCSCNYTGAKCLSREGRKMWHLMGQTPWRSNPSYVLLRGAGHTVLTPYPGGSAIPVPALKLQEGCYSREGEGPGPWMPGS